MWMESEEYDENTMCCKNGKYREDKECDGVRRGPTCFQCVTS